MFVLTNNSWAIQASMHARRFFVLNPNDVFSGKQTAAARDYFDKLLSVDPAAFAHHLYNRCLSGFNSRQPPLTDALDSQKLISVAPLARDRLSRVSAARVRPDPRKQSPV